MGGDAVVDVCTGYVGLAAWHSASSFVWHVVAVQSCVVSKQSLSAYDCREAQWVVSLVQEVYVSRYPHLSRPQLVTSVVAW